MTLTVSVVIPCYNAASFLRETLESVLVQTRPPFEVLVIDDGSTDGSAAIAEAFCASVRVIRQENQGESAARNRGVNLAQGEWIAFLDADDIWMPEKLDRQLALVAPDVIAVHTNYYEFGRRSAIRDYSATPEAERYTPDNMLFTPLFPSSVIVRKSHCPEFPTWTRNGEDWFWCQELAFKGRIRLVPEVLCGYRLHEFNQGIRDITAPIRTHQTAERWIQEHRSELSLEAIELLRRHWLKRTAKAALRSKARRDWDSYWKLRRHLMPFHEYPETGRILAQKVYPRWLYVLKDSVFGRHRNSAMPRASI